MMRKIFVYGTLCRGQCREACWPRPPVSVEVGYVRGRLFDLGPYPAMLAGDDWVRGECWTLREEDVPETVRVLDEIEGFAQPGEADLYQRCEVDVFRVPGANASAVARAAAYFLVPERLPKGARQIEPQQAAGSVGDTGCVYWPADDRSAEETSSLPDPFEPTA